MSNKTQTRADYARGTPPGVTNLEESINEAVKIAKEARHLCKKYSKRTGADQKYAADYTANQVLVLKGTLSNAKAFIGGPRGTALQAKSCLAAQLPECQAVLQSLVSILSLGAKKGTWFGSMEWPLSNETVENGVKMLRSLSDDIFASMASDRAQTWSPDA